MLSSSVLESLLKLWFGTLQPLEEVSEDIAVRWFKKDADFDAALRASYLELWKDVVAGAWEPHVAPGTSGAASNPSEALACLLVLDPLSRSIHRGRPASFAGDSQALVLARVMIRDGLAQRLGFVQRFFVYLPFMHSEALTDQIRSLELYEAYHADAVSPEQKTRATQCLDAARAHHRIIEQFGRFPHRNAILARASTPEEALFLTQEGSSF